MRQGEPSIEVFEQAGTPPDTLFPGTCAGDYVIEHFIAQGGCGAVYSAKHRFTSRPAALKILHASLVKAPKMVERFMREVEAIRLLQHPCIIEIYDIGELPDGRPFYVMEYLNGMTLEALLRARGRLSARDAFDVLDPVCSALSRAHGAGVVHRDVKASNVFIALDGAERRVKLLDFGVAKLLGDRAGSSALTSEGCQIGTLAVMAPEQILCGAIDERVDIYALGVLLYKLLTGEPPFRSRNLGELIRQHLDVPPPRPSLRATIPRGLDEIVLRCLEKRPELRFASVDVLRRALREVVCAEPAEEPRRATDLVVLTIAIQVRVDVRSSSEELDDALAGDLGRVLDSAEARLQSDGFAITLMAGMSLLAVKSAGDGGGAERGRIAALGLAKSLHEELARRPRADDRVDITIGVHSGEALVCSTASRTGPDRAMASLSALPLGAPGLWVKPALLQGLSGVEAASASGEWVSFRERCSEVTRRTLS